MPWTLYQIVFGATLPASPSSAFNHSWLDSPYSVLFCPKSFSKVTSKGNYEKSTPSLSAVLTQWAWESVDKCLVWKDDVQAHSPQFFPGPPKTESWLPTGNLLPYPSHGYFWYGLPNKLTVSKSSQALLLGESKPKAWAHPWIAERQPSIGHISD